MRTWQFTVDIHPTPDRWGLWRRPEQHRISIAVAGYAVNIRLRRAA